MSLDLPDFTPVHILVAGDVMLDRYWHGGTHRISPEAPVPVVRIEGDESRPGGAGNVALNIASVGARATLLGITGKDPEAEELERLLADKGVSCRFQRHELRPTITKLRIISRQQQLIRLDFEDGFNNLATRDLTAAYHEQLGETDLVILSDYGKGTLQEVGELIRLARSAGKPVIVDPKGTDFERYRGATLVTPNLSEFEAVAGSVADDDDLAAKGVALMAQYDFDALLITRGELGMTLLQRDRPARHHPTHAQEVYDVTGAGDTVISILATALASGMPLDAATQLANIAAGIVVGKLGTSTVSLDELKYALQERQVAHTGAVTEEELLEAMALARARGESIVMTNGCFDILHAGHVTYLEQASRLGDRLIVAVNVDETVRALKGADRPVNTLWRRMTVLAALGCVDWVVPFSEETPERLICRLKPDFLVKGGDNDPDKIPGARCVRESGGEVRIMQFVDDCSTTGMIKTIRDSELHGKTP
ncbi:bifunctional D-glycero-beta-D-manno-heptose-7-phosphate kinase/D-glycero-beta-D-manno-heptose 1-phosphate adenylyltransferase HldE [Sedimenticola hydrogenitrophicus]|uniref:bifunctional D-glycero-beta-D-manno-heptose-7-phosphate kinase/D-glycero-beta-D-manno-heptose 1-phosphate adenylyltransferase HldE n=1 Tax=Sedimenticola hydrogenitrophicus TaxID=2967975 RepID=UPI0023B1816B|nr:bifunctional D-glycero-beta-D-manno-heptose-7-phosphate kinase/D-glycero-beta-D-manno-heptose 1-phosphate adenylyltransferase HldE [Sedimenticola hydrogenitrophicus]